MGLGFSKGFVIFLFLSIAIAIGTEDWKNGAVLMAIYIICSWVWKILT